MSIARCGRSLGGRLVRDLGRSFARVRDRLGNAAFVAAIVLVLTTRRTFRYENCSVVM